MSKDNKSIDEWMTSGDYLPKVMRDFHDQKDLFKAIHETVDVKSHNYAGSIDWISGHCYVVDIFLWFMAKRGYTLQKCRQDLNFKDLSEFVAENKRTRDEIIFETLPRTDRRK